MTRIAIATLASLFLGACATTNYPVIKQAPPPAPTEPGAANYVWHPTDDYQLQVDQGFTPDGALLPRRAATYQEGRKVFELDQDCAEKIKEGVTGMGWYKLRQTLKIGGAEAVGAAVGGWVGIPNASGAILRELTSIAGFEGGFVGLASSDEQLIQILSGAHLYCVIERVQMHWSDPIDPLRHMVVVPIPGLHARHPDVMAPGVTLSTAYSPSGNGEGEGPPTPEMPPPPRLP